VFIGCPPDVGLVPQNHPLCRSDAEQFDFITSPTDPLHLFVLLKDIRRHVGA
jgi:hypothetical protein